MYDHSLFLQTLSDFTRTLVTQYDVDAVLDDLTTRLVEVLGLAGSGVALASDGRLQFATAFPPRVIELELVQHQHQAGPCVNAYRSGKVVAVTDLSQYSDRWPEYCVVAQRLGMTAVAGIPMRLEDETVGAINLYVDGTAEWPKEDLAAAVVMADMATGYLINASTLRQQEQLNEQLQRALDSKLIIEQAKGAIATSQGITVDDAFERIRRHARSHNVTVRAVAEAIVNLGLSI